MKTIAIDASRATRERKTGVEWYAFRLIEAMKKQAPSEWKVRLLTDRPFFTSRVDSRESIVESRPTHCSLLTTHFRDLPPNWSELVLAWPPRFLWSQLRLAAHLCRTQPDLFFSPVHVLPFFASSPAVVTIHDVDYVLHPEAYTSKGRSYLKLTTWWAVRRAKLILTPSEASKKNLVRYFRCPPEKIRVTPLGPMAQEIPAAEKIEAAKKRYGLEKYFIFVGRLETKKNAARIVQAFKKISAEFPETKIVLIGRPGRGIESVEEAIAAADLDERILRPGWISGEDVTALTAGAIGLIFASLAEGFGIPILDAFLLGTPVVTSKGIATEEVAGGAALLVDPSSVEEIAAAMKRLYLEPALREELARKGIKRVKNFSWEKTAAQTIAVFQEILK